MGILDRLRKNKNTLVQPKIIVEEEHEAIGTMAPAVYKDGRSYYSVWRPDPQSSTGRAYRVQIYGEMGTVEGSGETLGVAIAKANKAYDKKLK
jgi:hypothetical protein